MTPCPRGRRATRPRSRLLTLAPTFLAERELPHRMRIIAFSILTPFYFLKAGSLVEARAVVGSIGLIAVLLAIKMATKFIGILPLTRYHAFDPREGMYTTLMMSTGLTFGTISALWAHQQDHRPDAVYGPGHRGHRQRRRADHDRAELVPARIQADRRRARGHGGGGRGAGGAVTAPHAPTIRPKLAWPSNGRHAAAHRTRCQKPRGTRPRRSSSPEAPLRPV